MKIMILGGDGYCGWPTSLHLSDAGHDVTIVDNFARRGIDAELGTSQPDAHRVAAEARQHLARRLRQEDRLPHRRPAGLRLPGSSHAGRAARGRRALRGAALGAVLDDRPQARLLHAAQQRARHAQPAVRDSRDRAGLPTWSSSAPWASTARRTSISKRATSTSSTTVARTACPSRSSPAPSTTSPRCTTRHNMHLACKIWGMRSTDLNQGVVYGTVTPQTQMHPGCSTASTTTTSSARRSTASASRRPSVTR